MCHFRHKLRPVRDKEVENYKAAYAILVVMEIAHDVSLANYSTMRLGGIAAHLAEVRNLGDLRQTLEYAKAQSLPVIMIGSGSNIVWKDSGYDGLVIVNKIMGYHDRAKGSEHAITIGAGEPWDSVVARSVAKGLTGIEALSLIPGTTGATPIQNVGAYGQDISQTLMHVEAYDTVSHDFVNIPAENCGFGYRTSNFKTQYHGRYLITSITLHLTEANPKPPFYGSVQQYLEAHPQDGPITPAVIREAVLSIRSAKLPAPEQVANNGSFFANPIIADEQLTELLHRWPDMPHWPLETGGAKLPAAWLIEQAGFKDYHDTETGMATWSHQPLVLVNEQAHTTKDLLAFRDKLVDNVKEKFGITLVQEPELLP